MPVLVVESVQGVRGSRFLLLLSFLQPLVGLHPFARLLPSVALHFMVRTNGIWKNGSRMVTASFMECDEDASEYVL